MRESTKRCSPASEPGFVRIGPLLGTPQVCQFVAETKTAGQGTSRRFECLGMTAAEGLNRQGPPSGSSVSLVNMAVTKERFARC